MKNKRNQIYGNHLPDYSDHSDHAIDALRYAFTAMALKLTWSQKLHRWLSLSWKEFKRNLLNGIFTVAHAVGVGWQLQKLRHWLGLYPKFELSGRCMWCGENHD